MNKILVVIPTHNEVQSVPFLLDKIFSLSCSPSVLVVDDNSGDGTLVEVRSRQKKYARLFVLARPEKLGLGSAYREGFRFAREHGFDGVVQMDADMAHDPCFIPGMIDVLEDCDVVIASRYVRGGAVTGFPLGRYAISRAGNMLSKFLLRLPVADATSGFRAFRQTALERICVETTASVGFVFQVETVWRAARSGLRIKEVPFLFSGRKNQRSKFSFKICREALGKIAVWAFVGDQGKKTPILPGTATR